MQTEEIRAVVGRLGALVAEHYVFPETGREVADASTVGGASPVA